MESNDNVRCIVFKTTSILHEMTISYDELHMES